MAAAAQPRAVLVMAGAPASPAPGHALESLLGPERLAALGHELIRRAVRWGAEVATGAVQVAFAPAEAGAELEALVGVHARVFAQEGDSASAALGAASARVFAEPGSGSGSGSGSSSGLGSGEGPLLIAWADLPRWRPDHASGALEDLAAGCDVSVGPVFDGGFYLLALARPLPGLFATPEADWLGPNAMASAFAAANAAGLEVGMLRAERGLRRPEDVRAALADPLTDQELRRLLE